MITQRLEKYKKFVETICKQENIILRHLYVINKCYMYEEMGMGATKINTKMRCVEEYSLNERSKNN